MVDCQEIINKSIEELDELLNNFTLEQKLLIEKISYKIINTIRKGGCIFWCGNGGSASQSQHLSTELIGRFKKNRFPFKSISLSSDPTVLTCISNDFGYQDVFARQIDGLGNKGDILIALSTSGNSINIEKVIEKAKEKKITTVSFLGKGGGIIKNLADYSLVISSNDVARIQESHLLVGHIVCEMVEEELND